MPLVSQTPIDRRLDQLIPDKNALPYSAARYALFSGGKRLRPRLVLAVAGPLGLDAAAAIECMHTFSLIHDDLPCMDDDDVRRGKASLHKVVGEGQALLVGDYLQILAFEIIANSANYSDAQKVEMIQVLSKCCGASGMIGGQVKDLLGNISSWEDLLKIHRGKTGALMRASLLFGAIIANQPRAPLERCGDALGIAYQLFDDLQDDDTEYGQDELFTQARSYQKQALLDARGYPELETLIAGLFPEFKQEVL